MKNDFSVGNDLAEIISGGYKTRRKKMMQNDVSGRIYFIKLIFSIIFLIFVFRILFIATDGKFKNTRSEVANAEWISKRAAIVDKNGEFLAVNIPTYHLFIKPNKITNKTEAYEFLTTNFPEITTKEISEKLNSDSNYLYLKKNISAQQANIVKQSKLLNIGIEESEKRSYPKREIFSHIIGFIGADGNGLEGVEKWHNEEIKNQSENFKLTLDSRVQSVMYQELQKSVEKYHAKGAMGILMKSATGEIIAIVSLPDFDPENPSKTAQSNRFFKPTKGIYEMGSVFKIFNTSIAIESGMGLNKKYKVDKPIKIGGKQISDVATFKPKHPMMTVTEIMLNSCNVGSAQMAQDFPENYQKNFLKRLGLLDRIETDFGTTAAPYTPRKWGPTEKATVSYGHGISVTPIHIITAINAIVNGGIFVKPTILPATGINGRRVVDNNISENIRKIMYLIAEQTTAKKAKIAGIKIGGKTGTANKVSESGRGYDKDRVLTVFAGAFPIDSPQYTILVILDEPKGLPETFNFKTAAWNAVPTAGKVMEVVIPLLF